MLVTSTGYEVLSDVPRALDDVIISALDECVLGELRVLNYSYGLEASITFSASSSFSSSIDSLDFFDGYAWSTMEQLNASAYSFSYKLDFTYSSRLCLLSRVNTSGQLWHFSKTMECEALASEQMALDPIINATIYTEPPESPLIWTASYENASMIRVLFDILDAPLFEQYPIIDSSGRVVMDYRGQHEKSFWSEWFTGDEMVIRIVATESPLFGGVGEFRIRVDTIEVVYGDPVVPTTTPKVTINSTSTTTEMNGQSTSGSLGRLYTGLLAGSVLSAIMILVAYQLFRKKT